MNLGAATRWQSHPKKNAPDCPVPEKLDGNSTWSHLRRQLDDSDCALTSVSRDARIAAYDSLGGVMPRRCYCPTAMASCDDAGAATSP